MPSKTTKPATKTSKAVRKKSPGAKPTAAAKPRKSAVRKPSVALDLSAFPPESVVQTEKRICLACVMDVFTRHTDLTPKKAYSEISISIIPSGFRDQSQPRKATGCSR